MDNLARTLGDQFVGCGICEHEPRILASRLCDRSAGLLILIYDSVSSYKPQKLYPVSPLS